MSECTQVKDRTLWLIPFHQEKSVRFISYAMLGAKSLQRIWTRLLMLNLHPIRRKNIDFRSITKSTFLNWSLPVRFIRIYRDPTLIFRDHLHHGGWSSINLLMNYISVFRIIHHSEIRRHVLLVPECFRS